MIEEEWAVVPGYTQYAVSNYGRVLNMKFDRDLKPSPSGSGYYKVCLYLNNVGKSFNIHRLVAKMFHPDYRDDRQVIHKNGQFHDNGIRNLEMGDRRVRKDVKL